MGFSELYAKVLRKAWQQNDEISSDQVAAVLYFNGRPIPETHLDRPKMIRNAIMTLKRMRSEGLISAVTVERRKNVYKVKDRNKLRAEILEELRQLFGKDFV
jgi:hypothetical protein